LLHRTLICGGSDSFYEKSDKTKIAVEGCL